MQDAGGGQITVTYRVTSTAAGQYGYNGWFAYLAEDHSTRACNVTWANYLRHVGSLQADVGSVTNTVTFRPFFPRQIKLCVYLHNPLGDRAVFEKVVSIPAGYGVQRSSGYNCSHFWRYSAQDYYWLYRGDPSGLDADNDGAACEWNDGPAPGPQIPAEPAPPPTACSDGIDNDGDGETDIVDSYCATLSGTSEGPPPPKPQCSDDQDNDGDGAIDYPLDGQCKRHADKSEAPDPIPKLSVSATKRYIRSALRQEFEGTYRYGSFKRIARCVRLSRTRMKCHRVSWGIGDVSYRGWAAIWYANDDNGDVWWNYAFRLKRTNSYCVYRKRQGDSAFVGKRCTTVHRVR